MEKKRNSRTITMRIDNALLDEFKKYCKFCNYQEKIRQLMRSYIIDMQKEVERRTIKDKSINTDFLTK